ncbi:uncharacterized protein [Dermacentor andersoni]|uniref:uncharacterized protein n=1 Tax=Dermacentor andersoni TaxID=34620 RepID=UPI002415F770|nr:uncharacterized protein LOC129381220 [Dermacentor andersoni]
MNPETACHEQGVPTESRRCSCEPRDPRSNSAPGISSSTASIPSGSPATPWMTPKDLTRRRRLQRKRLQDGTTERPPTTVRCVRGRQLSQRVPVGQPALLQRSLRSEHLGPSPGGLDRSCTASAADGCLHFSKLSLWNNFLWVIIIKLREGRLGLACQRGRVVPLAFNMRRRRSFILVHWPLIQHRSIEFLEQLELRMSRKQFQLRDGLELSEHLRHARPCYHLLDYPTRDPMEALRSTLTTMDRLEILSERFSCVGVSIRVSCSTGATSRARSSSSSTGPTCPTLRR